MSKSVEQMKEEKDRRIFELQDEVELSKAINHAETVAESEEGNCAVEHRRLAEWLKELRNYRREGEQQENVKQKHDRS